jgi:hypothetical protein
MIHPDLIQHGTKCKASYSGQTTKQMNALVVAECLKFQNTGHRKHLDTIWDMIYCYILGLTVKEPSLLKGYDIEEVLGEAYFVMERTVKSFNPKYGVPYILYFRLSLGGHLAAIRVRDSRYVARDDVYADSDYVNPARPSDTDKSIDPTEQYCFNGTGTRPTAQPLDTIDHDADEAEWLKMQLLSMEPTDEVMVALAYISAWQEGKTPRGMVLSSRSGLKLKAVSKAVPKVPKLVRQLIL